MPQLTTKEVNEMLVEKLQDERNINERLGLSDDLFGFSYVDIQGDRVCMDGHFNADDLRKIAAEMDRLNNG